MYHDELDDLVESTLNALAGGEMISAESASTFEATKLGKAIVTSPFTPEDGIFIHKKLKRAVHAFVIDRDLDCLYMFTPTQAP